MEEMLHMEVKKGKNYFGLLVILSLFKNDFPWVYDLGRELVDVLKSKSTKEVKADAIQEYKNMIEFTLGHPLLREMHGGRKENMMYIKEQPYIINHYLDDIASKQLQIEVSQP